MSAPNSSNHHKSISRSQNSLDSEVPPAKTSQPDKSASEIQLPNLSGSTHPKLQPIQTAGKSSTAKAQNRGWRQLQGKTINMLVGAAVMLPILTVGTATYYFGSQAVNKQVVLAKRLDPNGLSEAELARQQQLLAVLLIGTGATALIAGITASLGTKRFLNTLNRSKQIGKPLAQLKQQWVQPFDPSDELQETLQTIVEEARISLSCDRVLVYRLNQDQSGTVIAESVAPRWTRVLGKSISDPLIPQYLQQHLHGSEYAIDNVATAGIEILDLEKLNSIEVQASLIVSILDQGKLFGLLVAHQCSQARYWQKFESELFNQFAHRVSLAINHAKLSQNLTKLKIQTEKDKKWTRRLTDATAHIRKSLQQKDVLEVSVEEVRRGLNCDRVLVYSLAQNQYGVVVAESVGPGWTRALGKTINDPCFEAKYLAQYRGGRVRAIDNIYRASISQCYQQQLESLEVKANLVTPILDDDQLFGLLVAHQCSQERFWQEDEIQWVKQIAAQVGFALDHVKLLTKTTIYSAQIQRESKWTHDFSDTLRSIRQSLNLEDVLEISVEEVRHRLNCDRVLIYSLAQNQYGVVMAESVALGWTRAWGKKIKDPCFEAKYLAQYRDGQVRAIDHIYQAGMSSSYIEQLESLEVKANLVAPILNGDRLFGLLVAHQCSQPRVWQADEIGWIKQIATQVGFALDYAKLWQRFQQQNLSVQSLNHFTRSLGDCPLNQSQLFKLAVEQVRQIMGLDRTMIYQFNSKSDGIVVAESVVSGYPQALRLPIRIDLAEYSQPNRQLANGTSKPSVIYNVEQANINHSYLKQLQALGVKTSIAAPIWQDEQLYGLLVGHQCQQPRTWQQSEIDFFTQLALQLESALNQLKLKQQLNDSQRINSNIASKQQQLSQLLEQNKTAIDGLKTQINFQLTATKDFLEQMQLQRSAERTITVAPTQSSLVPIGAIEPKTDINLNQTTNTVEQIIAHATEKIEHLNQSQQNLYHMINLIAQMREQIDRSQSQASIVNQQSNSIMALAQTVEPLSGQLIEETVQIKSLIENITIESDLSRITQNNSAGKTPYMLSEATSAKQSVPPVEQPKISTTDYHHSEAPAVEAQTTDQNQTTYLSSINQFVGEIARLSNQISQQSLAVTSSFRKVVALAHELSADVTLD